MSWSVAAAEPERWPFLHPARSAAVLAGEDTLGFLGEVHPLVAAQWDLPRSAAFAIDLGKLAAAAPEAVLFEPFGAYPELRQDIAVTLPDGRHGGRAARGGARGRRRDARRSARVRRLQRRAGRRRAALARAGALLPLAGGTLTDEDVAPLRERIVAAVERLGGELRG